MLKIILRADNDLKNIIKAKILGSSLNYYKCEFVDESYICKPNSNDLLIMFFKINKSEDIEDIKHLKVKNNISMIVFISENNNLIFECIDVNPQYFIRLNDFENDVQKAFLLIDQYIKNVNPMYIFKTNTCILRLNSSSIVYIESFGHYLTIHCKGSEYKIRDKISNIEEQLGCSNFLRIHKSYIVNIKFIKEVFNNKLITTDDTELPIGKSFKKSILVVLT